MALQIFLSSSLRSHVPDYDPAGGLRMDIEGKMRVAEVCNRLSIPVERVKIVMVDGIGRSLEHILEGDERVGLFPPVGGG
ncbi:MAG: thiamine biosynthesis protein ThiS [Desulfatiglandales bacterium]